MIYPYPQPAIGRYSIPRIDVCPSVSVNLLPYRLSCCAREQRRPSVASGHMQRKGRRVQEHASATIVVLLIWHGDIPDGLDLHHEWTLQLHIRADAR